MNPIAETNTATAPVEVAATETAPTPATEVAAPATEVAAPAKPTRKRKGKGVATVARRKVQTGKKGSHGAPKLELIGLHVKRAKGPFTKKDIFDLNAQSVSLITITKRIKELIADGKCVKMGRSLVNTSLTGKRPDRYSFDLSDAAYVKPKKVRTQKAVAAEPVVAEVNPGPINPEAAREFIANVELPPVPAAV